MDRYEVATPQACPGSTFHLPTAASSGLRRAPSEMSRHRTVKSELSRTPTRRTSVATGPGWLVWVRVPTSWATSCPFRHSTNHYHHHGDLVDGSREAPRLFCQKARDRPGAECTSRSGARDLFSLREDDQYDNSTTRLIDVRPRTWPCRPLTGAPEEAQKGPSGTG